MEVWYLLFGTSLDEALDPGYYMGRTTDKKRALQYFKRCQKKGSDMGSVLIITDSFFRKAVNIKCFEL